MDFFLYSIFDLTYNRLHLTEKISGIGRCF